jgi:hypothetical protein
MDPVQRLGRGSYVRRRLALPCNYYKDSIIEVKNDNATESEFYIIKKGRVRGCSYTAFKPIEKTCDLCEVYESRNVIKYTQYNLYVKKLSWKLKQYRILPIKNFVTKQYYELFEYELQTEGDTIKFPYRAEKIVTVRLAILIKEIERKMDDTETVTLKSNLRLLNALN